MTRPPENSSDAVERSNGFTKGPWEAKPDDYCRAFHIMGPDGVAITRITGMAACRDSAVANAHLIAASPTMFDALSPFAAFLDALEQMGGNTPKTGAFYTITSTIGERQITVEDFKAARAAIAKALGQ